MLVLQGGDVLQGGVAVDDRLGRGVGAVLGDGGVAVENEDPRRVSFGDGLDGDVVAGVRVGRSFDLKGGLQAEQVEDRAPGAALARGHVADVAAGDVNGHDG